MEQTDVLIIGGGAAGISAAKAAFRGGCRTTLVDRRPQLGGVLLQCTHRGFGNRQTGKEYIRRLLADFPAQIEVIGNTTVLSVEKARIAHLSGGRKIGFSRLILATGCREIPIGALPIAGTRPEGIYTAGQMQEMMNLYGFMPTGPVVILGSGDIGLILASQIAQLGIWVTLVEQKDTCGGMARNQSCLKKLPIRLLCGRTIAEVMGQPHLESCRLSDGTVLPCRTLLIAAGLRPERTLAFEPENPEWMTLCGNCCRIHPMVEGVVREGTRAGKDAAKNMRGKI